MTDVISNFWNSTAGSKTVLERNAAEAKVEQLLHDSNTIGRIVYSTTGGPLRTIVTGTKIRMSGIYQSVKARQSQPYESPDERTFMKLCEAEYSVRDWLSQPHRLEMFVNGRVVKYYPDFEVLKSSGEYEVVEIKRDKCREVRDELKVKLLLAEQYYRILGFRFRILDRRDLHQEPRYSNSEDIQRHAHTSYSEAELFRILQIVSARKGRVMPFGEIVERLGGGIVGKKKLCAMIVKRIFMINLDLPIDCDTPVVHCAPDYGVAQ